MLCIMCYTSDSSFRIVPSQTAVLGSMSSNLLNHSSDSRVRDHSIEAYLPALLLTTSSPHTTDYERLTPLLTHCLQQYQSRIFSRLPVSEIDMGTFADILQCRLWKFSLLPVHLRLVNESFGMHSRQRRFLRASATTCTATSDPAKSITHLTGSLWQNSHQRWPRSRWRVKHHQHYDGPRCPTIA